MTDLAEASRTRRLKAATREAHERLDARIMAGRPFESRERYGQFLAVQHTFHGDVDPLYADPALGRLLPDLAGRSRLALIERDMADLGLGIPDATPAPIEPGDLPAAIGWLYVAEGSNLGAAFLIKEAAALGLGEAFGARHLAGAPEGRGLHWRSFTAAVDALDLTRAEDDRAAAAAEAAFRRVRALADAAFA